MSSHNRQTTASKCAFNWEIYKNRKTALQHLKRNCTLVDTILETEDGSAYEFVHSQVISAFGNNLNDFLNQNGTYVQSNRAAVSNQQQQQQSHWSRWPGRVKLIRLPNVNKYTLGVLVECAYSGYIRTDLQSGGIWQVLKVANHYGMFEMIKACCNFLIKWLDRSNCVLFYHIGKKHDHPLQRSAWHKIRANFKYILSENLSHFNDNNRAPLSSSLVDQMATKQTMRHNHQNLHHCNYHRGSPLAASTSSAVATGNGNVINTNNLYDDYNLLLELAAARQQLAHQRQSGNNGPALSSQQVGEEIPIVNNERRDNNINNNNIINVGLETIDYEQFEPLLMHDKLNIESEETVWHAIKLWCYENLPERGPKLASLLSCMRFPRFRAGTDFSARIIWRDPLVLDNKLAQHELAILDRNHRDYLASQMYLKQRDGFSLPCALNPRQLRPRTPHSILLAIGGWQQGHPTRLIESYDLNCNLWFESKRSIMTPLAYHGIECIDGLLYIFGGTDGSEILNGLFTFDPVRGDCSQKRSMRESRCYVSTAHLGSNLYAIGGHNGSQRMKSAERYDLDDGFWHPIHEMNVARSDASACVYESHIYIAGGLNDQVIESSVEFYNDHDDTWTFITSMITPRTSFTLLLFKDALLAIGGNNGNERLSSVEQYNFSTKIWSHHSNMQHRRSTFSAALLDENKLFVVGGYNGQTPFNQVEVYDEESSNWITMQKIRYDRSGLKVIVVNDLLNADEYTFLGSGSDGACRWY